MLNEEQLKKLQKGDIIYNTCKYHWKEKLVITTKITYNEKYNCYCFNAKHIGDMWDKSIQKYMIDHKDNGLFLNIKEVEEYQNKYFNDKKNKLLNDTTLLVKTLYNMAETTMTKADKQLYKEIMKEL